MTMGAREGGSPTCSGAVPPLSSLATDDLRGLVMVIMWRILRARSATWSVKSSRVVDIFGRRAFEAGEAISHRPWGWAAALLVAMGDDALSESYHDDDNYVGTAR